MKVGHVTQMQRPVLLVLGLGTLSGDSSLHPLHGIVVYLLQYACIFNPLLLPINEMMTKSKFSFLLSKLKFIADLM